MLSCDFGWLSGCLCKWNTITGDILGDYLLLIFLWLGVMFFWADTFNEYMYWISLVNTFDKYLGGYICKWSRTVSAVTVLQQPPLTFTVSHSRPTKSITTTTITPTTTTNIDSLHKCWLFNFVLESVLSFDHSIKLPMEYCRRQNFHGYWAGTRSGRGNSSFFQRKLFIRSKKLFIKPEYLSPGLSKLFMRSQIKGACPLVRGLSVCTQ